eukprot:TRINITY_DN1074_c0_g1_i1.p1 TRINITY_DN1074_c0_g1~~TRINITY_DN1074_c0_g1_i1.p1  ORF type:complete len:566 (-),score=197.66 TRINITY_DN1074_c0_g1_i1:158-1855(-)
MMKATLLVLFIQIIYLIHCGNFDDSPLYAMSGHANVPSSLQPDTLLRVDPNSGDYEAILTLPDYGGGESLAYNTKNEKLYRFSGGYANVIDISVNPPTYITQSLPVYYNWLAVTYDEEKDNFLGFVKGDNFYIISYTDNGVFSVSEVFDITHNGDVRGIAIDGDYKYIYGCNHVGDIEKWNYNTHERVETYDGSVNCFGLTREESNSEYYMIGAIDYRYLLHFNSNELNQVPIEYVGQTGFISAIAWAQQQSGSLSCCSHHYSAGCSDQGIADCVCAKNSTCCESIWDESCVGFVKEYGCGDCSTGPCCEPHVTPGCQNRDISRCVCLQDNTCCSDEWTAECVEAVNDYGCGQCIGEDTDCCREHPYPSCEVESVADCLCQFDSYCCIIQWDDTCIDGVVAYQCGECNGVVIEEPDDDDYYSSESTCCSFNNTPGCSDSSIEDCVCSYDSFCCEYQWDQVCVYDVEDYNCASCSSQVSDCCESHESAGCSDLVIESCVCDFDSYCCENEWDAFCKSDIYEFNCGTCDNMKKRDLHLENPRINVEAVKKERDNKRAEARKNRISIN